MTGPRRLRGRLEDDRHVGRERPGLQPFGTHTELEELSVGRVTTRGRSRPGVQAILAAGALVVLLAVGFGALGGRRAPIDRAGASAANTGPTAQALAAGQTPAATPPTSCAAPPETAPGVVLQVGDTATPAFVEVLELPRGVPAAPGPSVTQDPGGPRRTRVATGVPAYFEIDGAACANAWMVRIGGAPIDALGNPGLNPAYASRNRFELFLAPYGGSVADLQAELVFQTMVIRATWPLIVEPYPTPAAFVESARDRWRATAGCDIFMALHGAPVGVGDRCVGSVGREPEMARDVRAGESLTFSIDGWQLESAAVTCGILRDQDFVGEPDAGCPEDEHPIEGDGEVGALARFPAPLTDGPWTLAISGCAVATGGLGSDSICGTWFVNVQVGA